MKPLHKAIVCFKITNTKLSAKCRTELARDALQDNTTRLHGEVIANLRAQWEQDQFVDYVILHDICDSIQDRAMLVLMQLQQRTITLGAANNSPLNTLISVDPFSSAPQNPAPTLRQEINTIITRSPLNDSTASGNVPRVRPNVTPLYSSITPPTISNTSRYPRRPDSARVSRERSSTDRRDTAHYKPMATTVTTTGLFGIGKRTKVEPAVSPPENPLVDEYLAVAMEDANHRLSDKTSIRSKTSSTSTPVSSVSEISHPAFDSWHDYHLASPVLSQRLTDSIISFDTIRQAPSPRLSGSTNSFSSQRPASVAAGEVLSSNRSVSSIDPNDLLPSETNKYAGFCEGAWRQQIGDRKRAMEERVRPGGMYNAAKYYQCKQCKFEGRLIPLNKKNNGFDMRVFKLVQGIQFRWEFMFKCHAQVKEACSDPTKATFGCIFCCAEGRGTPMFGGIQTFMNHLVEHREHLPVGEVLYRANCLVGQQAAIDEDFDINIISFDRGIR